MVKEELAALQNENSDLGGGRKRKQQEESAGVGAAGGRGVERVLACRQRGDCGLLLLPETRKACPYFLLPL